MNIHDLAARTGSAERQIRYMIAQGFVPPPRGPRSSPDYGEDHVVAIRRYLGLREMGLPPAAIRVFSERKGVVVLPLIDGVSLSIEARLIGRPLDATAISARLVALLQQLESDSPS